MWLRNKLVTRTVALISSPQAGQFGGGCNGSLMVLCRSWTTSALTYRLSTSSAEVEKNRKTEKQKIIPFGPGERFSSEATLQSITSGSRTAWPVNHGIALNPTFWNLWASSPACAPLKHVRIDTSFARWRNAIEHSARKNGKLCF